MAAVGIAAGCSTSDAPNPSGLAQGMGDGDQAGSPHDDHGDTPKDAGAAVDRGHPKHDAGVVTHDAGGAEEDACPPEEQDGGTVLPPVGPPDLARYTRQINQLFCVKLASCCGAATFDILKCIDTFNRPGVPGVGQVGLFAPYLTRGHLSFNAASAARCFADIAALGCGDIPASTFSTLQADCLGGVAADIPAGGTGCLGSPECTSPNHCEIANGVGTCMPPRPVGAACSLGLFLPSGDVDPNGNFMEAQAQCGYLVSGQPAYCANQDTDVGWTTKTNLCAVPRPAGSGCYFNSECASGSCAESNLPEDVPLGRWRCSDTGSITANGTCDFYRRR